MLPVIGIPTLEVCQVMIEEAMLLIEAMSGNDSGNVRVLIQSDTCSDSGATDDEINTVKAGDLISTKIFEKTHPVV